MNKYQEFLLDAIFKRYQVIQEITNKKDYGVLNKELDTLTINQDENYELTDYKFVFPASLTGTLSEIVTVSQKNKKNKIDFDNDRWDNDYICIDFDFNNPIKQIIFSFANNIADDFALNLNYVESDKKAYVEKLNKENQLQKEADLIKSMNVSHSTGNNLISIKFCNCSSDVAYTKIVLYDDNKNILGTFKVDEGMFFKSITDLAYGKYFYIVEQYNAQNELIIKSEYNEARLNASNAYSVKPFVCR